MDADKKRPPATPHSKAATPQSKATPKSREIVDEANQDPGSKGVVTVVTSATSTPIKSPAHKKSRTDQDHDDDKLDHDKSIEVDQEGPEVFPQNLIDKFDGCNNESPSKPKDGDVT